MCCRLGRNSFGRQAFTLVEILVVVVILGIAAAMIVPRVTDTGDLQVESAAREMLADLQYAQSEAIVTQLPTTVTFNDAAESYTLSNTKGTLVHPLTKRSFTTSFPNTQGVQGVTITSSNFNGGHTVTFDALGGPDNGGSVTLAANAHTYRVDVAAVTGKTSATVLNP